MLSPAGEAWHGEPEAWQLGVRERFREKSAELVELGGTVHVDARAD